MGGFTATVQEMPLEEFLAGGSQGGVAGASPMQLFGQMIQLAVVFGVVIALAFLFTRWIAGVRYRRGSGANLQLLESIALSQQTYLQLVRAGKRYFVVGLTKSSITHICELDETEITLADFSAGDILAFEKHLKKYWPPGAKTSE